MDGNNMFKTEYLLSSSLIIANQILITLAAETNFCHQNLLFPIKSFYKRYAMINIDKALLMIQPDQPLSLGHEQSDQHRSHEFFIAHGGRAYG